MDEKKLNESELAPESHNGGQEKPVKATDDAGVVHNGMRVHPQPTSDPLDPLNWSSIRKHSILGIVLV